MPIIPEQFYKGKECPESIPRGSPQEEWEPLPRELEQAFTEQVVYEFVPESRRELFQMKHTTPVPFWDYPANLDTFMSK